MVDMALLEDSIREDLNRRAPRVFAVLDPLRVVLDNFPEGQVEELEAVNNPEDPGKGTRRVPFSRVLYIEKADFRENPPKKYFRLSPGAEVRLRYGYIIKCVDVVKDDKTGEIVELHCTYDPTTRSGSEGRNVKGIVHWVSAADALDAEVRLYDRLFSVDDPENQPGGRDWKSYLNPNSLSVMTPCKVEPSLGKALPGRFYQFERQGYFCVDPDSSEGRLVFNRTVALRDTWAKIEKSQKAGAESGAGH
jgi:glutaminyl-tRNA synthetase